MPQSLQSNLTQSVTRAEFSALVVTLFEAVNGDITGRVEFVDTPNDLNVEKAAYIGVVTGVGDNRFNPNEILTREQAAVILSRLSVVFELDIDIPEWIFEVLYDIESISPWALESVLKVYRLGAITHVDILYEGLTIRETRQTEEGAMSQLAGGFQFVFAPHEPITREQSIYAVNLLYKITTNVYE